MYTKMKNQFVQLVYVNCKHIGNNERCLALIVQGFMF